MSSDKPDLHWCAVEHLAFVFRSIPKIPPDYGALVAQWRRSGLDIALHVAEGLSARGAIDGSRWRAQARGEIHECAAILDVVQLIGTVERAELVHAKALLERMLGLLEP